MREKMKAIIICSCGKQTIVRSVHEKPISHYEADDPAWMCWQGIGWFCGEHRHKQADSKVLEYGRELHGNRWHP